MSGTSADGIDAVLTRISAGPRRTNLKLVAHIHRPYPRELRERILHCSLHGTVAELCELNFELGEEFAGAALAVLRKVRVSPKDIYAIGSHGQTVHHLPNARHASTLQLGEPAVIAERTGIRTVADFRVADMAAGGQGAPLVPYMDWVLFTYPSRPRIVQNIGGIGNLTFLPAAAQLDDVLAFDTGPGNMLLDGAMTTLTRGKQSMDRGGKSAAQGKVAEQLLRKLMGHPFLCRKPPKTTGREEFGEPFLQRVLSDARRARLSTPDLLATLTAFTAASIADAYVRFVFPRFRSSDRARLQVILGGGGAKNPTLKRMLAAELEARQGDAKPEILTHEDFGIPNAAKEAMAFALLAHEALHGRAANVPSATGARHPAVLGKVCYP